MSAHAPGPWHTDGIDKDEAIIMSAEMREVAYVPQYGAARETTQVQREIARGANMRLIAAAPELLEALKAMLESMRNGANSMPTTEYEAWNKERYSRARAAIAKAEGK